MKQVLNRFVDIWKPDFLKKLLQMDNQKTTWNFWFFYNSILAILFSIVAVFTLGQFLNKGLEYFAINYPQARVTLENGKLSTEGFNEPIFFEDEKSVFIMDTNGEKYESSILDKYSAGSFIGATKIYYKTGGSSIETRVYDLSKIEQNFSLTQQELNSGIKGNSAKIYMIVFALFIVWTIIFLAGFKLISALWWALLFWVLAMILGIKELNFKKTYYAVLNFYVIVLLFQGLLLFTQINFPFSTTLVFVLLFGLNFLKIKQDKRQQEMAP